MFRVKLSPDCSERSLLLDGLNISRCALRVGMLAFGRLLTIRHGQMCVWEISSRCIGLIKEKLQLVRRIEDAFRG